MRRFALLLLSLTACLSALLAQEPTQGNDFKLSPDTASVYYFNADIRWNGSKLTKLSDTLLTGFQYYDPVAAFNTLSAVNGNIGLAYKSLFFEPAAEAGFRFAPSVFNLYLIRNDNLRYYRSFTPYSNVAYSFGSGKEQLFSVTHSQNIARGLSFGVDLRIINSIGLYTRQKSDNSSVALQGQFISDNERYAVLASYRNNRYKWRENGGIVYDSVFTQNLEEDRQRVAIRLSNADNLIKESGVFVRQYYYFGRNPGKKISDTLQVVSDSLMPPPEIQRTQQGPPSQKEEKLPKIFFNPERSNFFRHTFTYTRNAFLYSDANPKSGYYPAIFVDSVKTFDSIYYHEFLNELVFEGGVGKTRGTEKAILLRAGIEHAISLYKNGFDAERNDSIKKSFTRITPFAYLSMNAFGVARAEGKIWITNGAPFNGDKGIAAMLTLPGFDNSSTWGNLYASVALNALQPDYIFQYHHSNHFSWENSLGQQTIFSGKVMYSRKNFKAGFNLYNLDGYVYFDENIQPARAGKSFAVSQAYAETNLHFGNFDLQAFATWQKISNESFLRLPEIAGRISGYYSLALFKRALYLQAGLSLMYNSSFYADAYMPALRSYYIQNQVETGNYPYVDGFINLRVKRARMFLVMKHLNSGLSGYNYIMVPSYPMPDRGLRFGVSWNFFD